MQSLTGSAHLYRIDPLHEDEHLMVVNKPSGLAVHRGWAADPVNAVKLVRRMAKCRVHPIHRLDRGTSGALVFALDPETASLMQDHFRERTVEKRYLALVRGIPPEEGEIDHAIPRSPKGPRVDAITTFRRLGTVHDRYSLVEARPQTGRLHQIRRHLKHISHPLIGDTRYGDGRETRTCRERFGLLRLALHAYRLDFAHPRSGERVEVRAPLPDDLRVPLERMGFSPKTWKQLLLG